jgi:prepilin peptidase CpaA
VNVFLIVFVVFGMTLAAAWDVRTRKIPNFFTFPMMFLGFTYHGVTNGLSGLGFSAAGVGLGIGVFLIPYLKQGMGAGDAKLMGAAGAFLGPNGVLMAAAISIVFGGIYAIVLLALHHRYCRSLVRRLGIALKTFFLTSQIIMIPPGKDDKQPVLSYALPIALGTMCCLYLEVTGSHIIQNLLGFNFNI